MCRAGDMIVSLTLINAGSNTWNGDYAYPYNVSVNPSSTPLEMMCDAYTQQMAFSDVWEANASVLTATAARTDLFFSSSKAFANTTDPVIAYNEGAYIFLGVAGGTIDPINGNVAMWYLFDPALASSLGATLDSVDIILGNALSHGSDTYSGVTVYTPLPSDKGTPQEFFGVTGGAETSNEQSSTTPEPSSWLFLAGGGAALAAIGARRSRRTARH